MRRERKLREGLLLMLLPPLTAPLESQNTTSVSGSLRGEGRLINLVCDF